MKAIDFKFITSCHATVTSYSNSLTTTGFNLTTTGITDMNTRNNAAGLTPYIERQISLLKASGRQRTPRHTARLSTVSDTSATAAT